jgi:hypothetical protein
MIHQISVRDLLIQLIKLQLALMGLALSLSPLVLAQDSIAFEKVSTIGSGCPEGSTAIVISPDKKTLSVLFSEMVAEVPQFDGNNENDEGSERLARHNKNMARKVCRISVEADVLPGHQVTGVEVSADFRGLTIMDRGTMTSFSSHFLEWRGHARQTRKIGKKITSLVYNSKSIDEDWFESKSVSIPVESSCDEQKKRNLQFVLRNVVKARILKNARSSSAAAFISLDSADLAGVLKLKVTTRKCPRGSVRLSREEILRRRRAQGVGQGQDQGRGPRGVACPRGHRFDARIKRCRPMR